jgi:urease accessory protein UreE
MCGEVDEDGPSQLEDQLYLRFLSHARSLLAKHGRSKTESTEELFAYMDKLFADALSRTARDGEEAQEDKRYQRLAAQPLVFARLAGFLAAHLSLQEDPLRKVMEALMLGYAEAEEIEPDHGHDHDHEHGHSHDHGQDHHH